MSLDKLPYFISIGSIYRNSEIIIPNTHTEILPGDELLLFTKEKNITKAAIQYKRKMHFLTEGDTLAGGKIIELSATKLIFEKDGESSEHVVVSR